MITVEEIKAAQPGYKIRTHFGEYEVLLVNLLSNTVKYKAPVGEGAEIPIESFVREINLFNEAANARQVGGNHYRKAGETGEQHWDRIYRLFGPGYFIGNITKYVERYQDKDGIEDLEKCLHYVQKLLELERAKPKPIEEGRMQ